MSRRFLPNILGKTSSASSSSSSSFSKPPLLLSPSSFSLIQVAHFSKYISKSRAKRLPLTTKRAGKGYYKGNRTRKEGKITSLGRFVVDPRKCTEIVVPDFTNCGMKAYVGPGAKRNIRSVQVDITA